MTEPTSDQRSAPSLDVMESRVADLARRLGDTGYLCDEELATVLHLSLVMGRPLLVEGEPGTGKTALAEAIAIALGQPLIRLQCYEGIDATQALYDWDFPRQILHLRALEALSGAGGGPLDLEEAEKGLYDERFLLARPVLAALQQAPAVLLVDEVDRADDEFEAFLLEFLSDFAITIPELGTVTARRRPLVVLTSNRTRELHDALKRRCLYHWIDYPSPQREAEIVRARLPGVGETITWARALLALDGDTDLEATLGVALKVREDIDRVRRDRVLEGA